MRLLGAKIGRDVTIYRGARLGEYDLLTVGDGAQIDRALVRGFCVERDGFFRLDRIRIGARATVNTYTQLAPGAIIGDDEVFGPHSSSHDEPSPRSYQIYNRTLLPEPRCFLKLLVAWPLILLVTFVTFIPWALVIWGMIEDTFISYEELNSLESVIRWFASPQRIAWHVLARIVRVVLSPLIQVVLGMAIKRLLGLNRAGTMVSSSQWSLLRRYVNSILLSQAILRRALDILGTHYEATSIIYRLMGAKIGRRVYWPGSGIHCPDPELLEVGDDVVFGSRSELFTCDRISSEKIVIGDGAMIADRVVLLPGTTVGRKAVLGSGALGRRGAIYPDGSTWVRVLCERISPELRQCNVIDGIREWRSRLLQCRRKTRYVFG
jgi:carbonic anhydrase/acetyltransferase-like protein (isoleucine patch superfamily)